MKETAGLHYEEFIITISACFIVLAGIVAPLSFFLAGKYTTHIKEPARPTKEKTQAEIDQEEAAKAFNAFHSSEKSIAQDVTSDSSDIKSNAESIRVESSKISLE